MESFEITVNEQSYKVSRNTIDDAFFNVFNHATYHIIQKNENGDWVALEHRFGTEKFPLRQAGQAIDSYYSSWQIKSDEFQDIREA